MFVKQIDMNEALRLASKGMEILVMVPSGDRDVSWEEHMPDTLQNLLEGCMFFRKEPAADVWDELTEGRVVSPSVSVSPASGIAEALKGHLKEALSSVEGEENG